MNSNTLKHSAIALFIGSIISGTALSADGTPAKSNDVSSAIANLANAISNTYATKEENKQDLSKIKNGIKNVAEATRTLSEVVEDIDRTTSKLDKVVGVHTEAIGKGFEEIGNIAAEIDKKAEANKSDIATINKNLSSLNDQVNQKVDKAEINTLKAKISEQLDLQKEELGKQATSLKAKAGRQEMNEALDKKADLTELNELTDSVAQDLNEHEAKIDAVIKQTTQNESDIATTNQNLSLLNEKVEDIEVDLTDVHEQVNQKVDKTEINTLKAKISEQLDLQKEELGKQATSLKAKAGRQEMNEALDKKADLTELNELTDSVAQDLNEHEAKIGAVIKQTTQNESDIAATNQNLSSLNEKVEDIETDLNNLGADVSEQADKLAALEKTKAFTEAKTIQDSLDKKADKSKVEADIAELQKVHNASVEYVDKQIDNLTDYTGKLSDDIDAHREAIEAVAEKTDQNAQNFAGLTKHIAEELAPAVKDNADTIEELDKDLGTAEQNIHANAESIAKLGAQVDNHKEAIETVAEKVDQNAQNFAGLTKHIAEELAPAVEENVNAIAANKTEIVKNSIGIQRNLAGIQANKTATIHNHEDIAKLRTERNVVINQVAQNTSQIRQNTAQIAHNSARIDHLDRRVDKLDKDMRKGLAAQAALTGLFQPYKVGHANFTAAVGGYKSQTAVAIGTGYRINENVAVKTGVAFSNGGGAAYNAGVNFEW